MTFLSSFVISLRSSQIKKTRFSSQATMDVLVAGQYHTDRSGHRCHSVLIETVWCAWQMILRIEMVQIDAMCLLYEKKPLLLIHIRLDKMAAISQTIFCAAFSWMKSFVFWLNVHWSLFLNVQSTITQHWLRSWLGVEEASSHFQN